MNINEIKQFVQVLAGAIKGLRLYAVDHPATGKQVQTLHDGLLNLLQNKQKIKMGLLEGTLFVEDHLFVQEFQAAAEIARVLNDNQILGIEFYSGLSSVEIQALLGALYSGEEKGEAFSEVLQQKGVERIRAIASPDEDEETGPPRKVYRKALKVVDQIFNDVRMGEIPSSTEALNVVKSMAKLTLTEPHALFALSMLKDYDNYTFTHSVNVSVLSLAVGRACDLSEERLRVLGLGGLLHDLGKLKIDVGIITKPGRLTESEFDEIKLHPGFGAEIIKEMEGVTQEVMDIVLCHHTRFDRTGYPDIDGSRQLSDLVDMTAIADSYDAMTTLRSYQRPFTPRGAINRLKEVAGTFLNPNYVTMFIDSLGPYPVGSLVRLDKNEIGLVIKVDAKDPSLADIKLIFDSAGNTVQDQPLLYIRPENPRRIIAEVDPASKGLEVTDFID